nr:hypothetical protein [Thauera sp. K11]
MTISPKEESSAEKIEYEFAYQQYSKEKLCKLKLGIKQASSSLQYNGSRFSDGIKEKTPTDFHQKTHNYFFNTTPKARQRTQRSHRPHCAGAASA